MKRKLLLTTGLALLPEIIAVTVAHIPAVRKEAAVRCLTLLFHQNTSVINGTREEFE